MEHLSSAEHGTEGGSRGIPDIWEEQGLNFEISTPGFWTSEDMPLHYRINDNTADCAGEYEAVEDAFQTWEDYSLSEHDVTCDGTTAIATRTYNDQGGNVNVVFWGYVEDYLAMTDVYFSGTTLLGFDIEFNDDNYTWCIGSTSGEYDVQNCATHETGHVMPVADLYDSTNNGATMYGYIDDDETKKRSLTTGDELGAQYTLPEYTKPTVTITDPDDLDTVAGTVTITATATISGYSISEVKYKIADVADCDYDSGWNTMTESGGSYSANWYSTSVDDDNYYITVRAKSNGNIYGYDWIRVTVDNGT